MSSKSGNYIERLTINTIFTVLYILLLYNTTVLIIIINTIRSMYSVNV